MDMNGQLQAPVAIYPKKIPPIGWIPEIVWTSWIGEKFLLFLESNLIRPVSSLVAILTELSRLPENKNPGSQWCQHISIILGPVAGFDISGVEPSSSATRELISKINLREMSCEDGKWMELAQDRVQ
jgi:hypothetical protein